MGKKTSEQDAVIAHPLDHHARVLAVAGSGKTTTMVLRIKELVENRGVNPTTILVLMFNKLAREQFKEKMERFRIPLSLQPEVHTFHSFSYKVINHMVAQGVLPRKPDTWTGDKEEKYRQHVLRAIESLQARGEIPGPVGQPGQLDSVDFDDGAPIPYTTIDPGEAIDAIGLWKGSLIPPQRAGYRGSEHLPLIYQEFERLRSRADALTFDDYVPLAVDLLENNPVARGRWTTKFDHLIIDEYQDINYGQQKLIELLAGQRADVMVVGDDDQTIYEWRGARPKYMIREFGTVFSNKPQIDYKLSHSFRFGPIVAQCAHNVIERNTDRVSKPLIAYDGTKSTQIHVLMDSSEQQSDVSKALADQIESLRDERGTAASDIIVLARMYVQLSGLETEFLARRIPYRVEGQKPFLERRELRALLDYVRLASVWDVVPGRQVDGWLLSVANVPNRKISREVLSRAMQIARMRKQTVAYALGELVESPQTTLNRASREKLEEFISFLDRVHERLDEMDLMAGALLRWLIDAVDYYRHFDDYYGKSEDSVDRKSAVELFVQYADKLRLKPLDFLHHVDGLDPTQGEPEENQICMTTIFRTKGLEYDYVVIPQCEEGYMPALYGTECPIYDTAGRVQEPEPSEAIESERRLFYVAITRGKKCVYIGASDRPKMGVMSHPSVPSRFLEEIQHESVVTIMTPYAQVTAGNHVHGTDLLAALHSHGGHQWVREQFIPNYLAHVGDEPLIGRAATILATSAELPFGYKRAYPASDRREPARSASTPQRCARCNQGLASGARFCGRCGMPVSGQGDSEDLPF